jgi:hypothetical protein
MKKPLESRFPDENPNFSSFSLQNNHPCPESGSEKHFHASKMLAIDSHHKITPIGVVFREKFWPKIHVKNPGTFINNPIDK